jgi:hypothetical protein
MLTRSLFISESSDIPVDKPVAENEKPAAEMKDAPESSSAAVAGESVHETVSAGADTAAGDKQDSAVASAQTPKSKVNRKSIGGSAKGKKLNKKASKAKIHHIDAKPGDFFFAKLKGFPPWPSVVCDEDMLSHNLLNRRPVSAAREDGSYREDFADGGKKVMDRTFPIMFLHTNEL